VLSAAGGEVEAVAEPGGPGPGRVGDPLPGGQRVPGGGAGAREVARREWGGRNEARVGPRPPPERLQETTRSAQLQGVHAPAVRSRPVTAKGSMQPRRRVRPPTARELDPARGDVAFAARPGYDLRLAWVRGRHDTGAPLPVMQPGPRDGDPVIGDARRPRPA